MSSLALLRMLVLGLALFSGDEDSRPLTNLSGKVVDEAGKPVANVRVSTTERVREAAGDDHRYRWWLHAPGTPDQRRSHLHRGRCRSARRPAGARAQLPKRSRRGSGSS